MLYEFFFYCSTTGFFLVFMREKGLVNEKKIIYNTDKW